MSKWKPFRVGSPTRRSTDLFAHQTFTDIDDLARAAHKAVHDHNVERMVDPLAKPRVSAKNTITPRGT